MPPLRNEALIVKNTTSSKTTTEFLPFFVDSYTLQETNERPQSNKKCLYWFNLGIEVLVLWSPFFKTSDDLKPTFPLFSQSELQQWLKRTGVVHALWSRSWVWNPLGAGLFSSFSSSTYLYLSAGLSRKCSTTDHKWCLAWQLGANQCNMQGISFSIQL